ncbi:MAG: uncharacterized protein A8A55_0284 [Amphiamblys sp. WSBS2006]|nr:MAG: uncharacterized protein A8A55_0284 [Amphiamblys sp. WSBS2006]
MKGLKRSLELEIAKEKIKTLQEENLHLQKTYIERLAEKEREQEFITNRLLLQMEVLKHENGEMMKSIEREEEGMINSISKRLLKINEEKEKLETELARERQTWVTEEREKTPPNAAENTSPLRHSAPSNLKLLARDPEDTLPVLKRKLESMERLYLEKNREAIHQTLRLQSEINLLRTENEILKRKFQIKAAWSESESESSTQSIPDYTPITRQKKQRK